jgi:hypothetical protein
MQLRDAANLQPARDIFLRNIIIEAVQAPHLSRPSPKQASEDLSADKK